MTTPPDIDELVKRARGLWRIDEAARLVDDLGDALEAQAARVKALERERDLAVRREQTARKFWIRDTKEALAGKPQALRNRLELCDLPPVRMEHDPLDGMPLLVFEDEKRQQSDEQRIAALEAQLAEFREAAERLEDRYPPSLGSYRIVNKKAFDALMAALKKTEEAAAPEAERAGRA